MSLIKWLMIIIGSYMTLNLAQAWEDNYLETGRWIWSKDAGLFFLVGFIVNLLMMNVTARSRKASEERILAGNRGNISAIDMPVGCLTIILALVFIAAGISMLVKKEFMTFIQLLVTVRFFSFYWGFLVRRTPGNENERQNILDKRAKEARNRQTAPAPVPLFTLAADPDPAASQSTATPATSAQSRDSFNSQLDETVINKKWSDLS